MESFVSTFVTELECSLTGERYPAGQVHGLSRAGRPLLVRYDLEAVGRAVNPDTLERRPGGFWKYRELLPIAGAASALDLGEVMTPILRLG